MPPSRLTSTHSPMGSGGEQGYAAGDLDDRAGDVAGLVRAQESDRVRDVFRLSESLENRPRPEPVIHWVGLRRGLARLALDDAGGERVRGDVVPPALQRGRLRQPDQR